MGSVCKLLEGSQLEALAPEIAEKLGLGLRWVMAQARPCTHAHTAGRCKALCAVRSAALRQSCP